MARKDDNNVSGVPFAEFYLSGRELGLDSQVSDKLCLEAVSKFFINCGPTKERCCTSEARFWFDKISEL